MSTIWRESGVQKAVKYNLRGSSLRKASPAHSYDEEDRSESKQDKVNTANTADSASVFLIILWISQNRWSVWSGGEDGAVCLYQLKIVVG